MDLGKLSRLSEHRKCVTCGAEFHTRKVDGIEETALQQFSDHLTEHQPTAEQWKAAYDKIKSYPSSTVRLE